MSDSTMEAGWKKSQARISRARDAANALSEVIENDDLGTRPEVIEEAYAMLARLHKIMDHEVAVWD